jgi:hypothetical protein
LLRFNAIAASFCLARARQRSHVTFTASCDSRNVCQMRARDRRTDLVPIRPTDHHEDNFGHLQADTMGPMSDGLYKYALVLTDVQRNSV